MKYLSCQTDTEYYKHLDIRRILFSLSCSLWYILSGVFLFLKWSFLEHPSSNILNLHLILSWDSACIVWPSLLIFFPIFIVFRLSTVLGLSETLLKDSPWQFSCHVIPKTSLQALYGSGERQDEGNPIYFLFTCVPHSNDKAHGDNGWDQGSCPCLVPPAHICETRQRKDVIVACMRRQG